MRAKLQSFSTFANSLLPHEADFLLEAGQLEDPDRIRILERIRENARRRGQFLPYDTSIDKRKYSDLKNWIRRKLSQIDVDEEIRYITDTETAILTDAIRPREEAVLLRKIKAYTYPSFFFGRWYELMQRYHQFLLIRLRPKDYELLDDFLCTYKVRYDKYQRIQEQLHQATIDIVQQYKANTTESIQWERWLNQVFYDEEQDGYSRYSAFVRLSFISFNYRRIESLWDKFDYLDHSFRQGKYYSRRFLINYYHLRLIAHAKLRQYEQAVEYGYYAIRDRNHDYLFYVNNLSAVLLRAGKAEEALRLMRSATEEMKASKNMHNKIGFVAYYIKALLQNGKRQNAVSYANTFYQAYHKEILQVRWHTYFTIYLEALFEAEAFERICSLERKHKLVRKEEELLDGSDKWPFVQWWVKASQYQLQALSDADFAEDLNRQLQQRDTASDPAIAEQLGILRDCCPKAFRRGVHWPLTG